MDVVQLSQAPVAKAEMLIRKPVAEVFEAFVDPDMTTRFWFTRSSGRLEAGKHIRWDWKMRGASAEVNVIAIEPNKRITVEWSGGGAPTTVEWIFVSRPDETTFVSISNSGFVGNGDEIVKQAIGSTEGFTLVLCGLKALLEHDILLNLVPDRFSAAVG